MATISLKVENCGTKCPFKSVVLSYKSFLITGYPNEIEHMLRRPPPPRETSADAHPLVRGQLRPCPWKNDPSLPSKKAKSKEISGSAQREARLSFCWMCNHYTGINNQCCKRRHHKMQNMLGSGQWKPEQRACYSVEVLRPDGYGLLELNPNIVFPQPLPTFKFMPPVVRNSTTRVTAMPATFMPSTSSSFPPPMVLNQLQPQSYSIMPTPLLPPLMPLMPMIAPGAPSSSNRLMNNNRQISLKGGVKKPKKKKSKSKCRSGKQIAPDFMHWKPLDIVLDEKFLPELNDDFKQQMNKMIENMNKYFVAGELPTNLHVIKVRQKNVNSARNALISSSNISKKSKEDRKTLLKKKQMLLKARMVLERAKLRNMYVRLMQDQYLSMNTSPQSRANDESTQFGEPDLVQHSRISSSYDNLESHPELIIHANSP